MYLPYIEWRTFYLVYNYSTNILVRLLTVNMKNCLTQKSENVRPHSGNSIENATAL